MWGKNCIVGVEKRPDVQGAENTEIEHPVGRVPDRLFAHRPSPTITNSIFYFPPHI
jgi:hypothetical protein